MKEQGWPMIGGDGPVEQIAVNAATGVLELAARIPPAVWEFFALLFVIKWGIGKIGENKKAKS